LALEAVAEPSYRAVEKSTPHKSEYRVSGFPKDSLSEYSDKASYPRKNIIRGEFKKAS
jgi:hypothetical protein